MGDSGLFDVPPGPAPSGTGGIPFEQRLDRLAASSKQATQLAGKIRVGLNQIAVKAQTGMVKGIQDRLDGLSENMAELSALITSISEHTALLQPQAPTIPDYVHELQAALSTHGVEVTKGPDPYWLVYPAWFQVERNAKGNLEVILNGRRIDSIRPAVVASEIANAVNEKFNAEQFKGLLISVRDLIRRAGATGTTLALDDVYAVLTMGGGRRTPRSGDLSRADFYYSVHRLAEAAESTPGPALSFPAANYNATIFFTKDGDSRKYLTVGFPSVS